MIVQPDFLEHWKTRQLIELTGDESSPLAVLRLWAHCQHNKRSRFPDMTPQQLASICRWGERKPACHVALTRAGFVDKLTPKGFAAHEWSEHNRQLLQKWDAGKNGGRPAKEEKANELPLSEKPTDNRPITVRELDRLDKTRPDEIDKTRPVQMSAEASPVSEPRGADGSNSVSGFGGTGLDGLVASIAGNKTCLPFTPPTMQQVSAFLHLQFAGAERYASAFIKSMSKQKWRDREGGPITNWQSVAKAYASKAAMNSKP